MPDLELRQRVGELTARMQQLEQVVRQQQILLGLFQLQSADMPWDLTTPPYPGDYAPKLRFGYGEGVAEMASGAFPHISFGNGAEDSLDGAWLGRTSNGQYLLNVCNAIIRGELRTHSVVREVQAATAGTFIVSDVADVLTVDVAPTDVVINVKTNGLAVNHIILIKPDASRTEWMRIEDNGITVPDGYQYAVTRDLDGTGANTFYAGEALVARGTATVSGRSAMWGEGFGEDAIGMQWGIDDTSWGGIGSAAYGGWVILEGTEVGGPYIGIMRREGGAYNDYSLYVCIGKLTSFLDYAGSEEYGFGVGEIGDFVSWDKLQGLRIQAGGGATQLTGSYMLIPSLTTSQRDALTAANGLLIYNSTLNKFQGYENSAWTSFT